MVDSDRLKSRAAEKAAEMIRAARLYGAERGTDVFELCEAEVEKARIDRTRATLTARRGHA